MEALTGATVAALTVYDMCKALSHAIVIGPRNCSASAAASATWGRHEARVTVLYFASLRDAAAMAGERFEPTRRTCACCTEAAPRAWLRIAGASAARRGRRRVRAWGDAPRDVQRDCVHPPVVGG
jgi:hypothetical protein